MYVFVLLWKFLTGKKMIKKKSQNSQESCNFIKKETLAQVFSCEYGEIFKNTFGPLFP